MAKQQTKPERFQLPQGLPSLEDLIAVSKKLTGRDPTPEELAGAKKALGLE